MTIVRSRDNAKAKRWRALGEDARLRRAEGRALIEGEHLVAAALERGLRLEALIVAESAVERFGGLLRRAATTPAVLDDRLFASVVDVETPAGIAAEIAIPSAGVPLREARACVFLEGVQDAGNVGAILRSAAAFGLGRAVLGPGCADAWSPKVLRAGMGAHFLLGIEEAGDLGEALARFGGRLACTVPHGGTPLAAADLTGRLGWLFGSEGRGLREETLRKADLRVTIPMPGGAESLNVAAAAAICFYELSTRGARS